MDATEDVTDLLVRAGAGDRGALDCVFPVLYAELRRIAHRQLGAESCGHTLGTTALVHEAYLRMVDQTRAGFSDRAHFLAIAATAMRRILVDYARRHRSEKRGGSRVRVSFDALDLAADRADMLIELDDALTSLEALDERQARVIECRFFGGLTEEETASVLGIGLRTAKRDWARARSWLYAELYSVE